MSPTKTQEELAVKLTNAILEQIKKDSMEVLPYPVVALRLRKVLDNDDYGTGDLEEVIQTDQALSATVLRHSNAAAFRGKAKVTELRQAISRIGAREVERVVLAAALGAKVCTDSALRVMRFNIWRDALLSAHFCQILAKERQIKPREAFLCGLLHDLGMVVAVGIMESIITEDEDFEPMPAAHWKELAQEQHTELGLVLANRWELPDVFKDVITRHHDLPQDAEPVQELVQTVDRLIVLLNQTPHITEEVLEPIFPAEEERQLIWSRLSSVCSLVAALSQPPKTQAKNYCSAEHPKIDEEVAREAGFPVTLQTSPPKDYTASCMDEVALQIDGDTRQQAGTLIKVALDLDLESLEMWAKVSSSRPQGDGHRVELIPFGMDDDTKRRWDQILCWLEVPLDERPARIQQDLVANLIERLGEPLAPDRQKVALHRAAALISELEKRKVSGDPLNALANLKKARKKCEAGATLTRARPTTTRSGSSAARRPASKKAGPRKATRRERSGPSTSRRWALIVGGAAVATLAVWLIILFADITW